MWVTHVRLTVTREPRRLRMKFWSTWIRYAHLRCTTNPQWSLLNTSASIDRLPGYAGMIFKQANTDVHLWLWTKTAVPTFRFVGNMSQAAAFVDASDQSIRVPFTDWLYSTHTVRKGYLLLQVRPSTG